MCVEDLKCLELCVSFKNLIMLLSLTGPAHSHQLIWWLKLFRKMHRSR